MKTLSKYMYTDPVNTPRCQIDNDAQDVKDGMKNRLKMQLDYDEVMLDRDPGRTLPYWGKPNPEWAYYVSEANRPQRVIDMAQAVDAFREKFGDTEVEEVDDYKELDILVNRECRRTPNAEKMKELKRRIAMEERRIAAGE
jgi:hypothetical protein